MNKPSGFVTIPLLLVNWVAFAQVISFQGLAIWVIGGSLAMIALVTWLCSIDIRWLALILGGLLTWAIPVLADTLGGQSAGPITRASLIASGTAFAMALITQTRYSLWMLVPSALMLAGALGLGAATNSLWLSGAWVVIAGATGVMLGSYRATDLRARARLRSLVITLGIVGLIGVAGLTVSTLFFTTPWTIAGSGDIASITPPNLAAPPVPIPSSSIPPTSPELPTGDSTPQAILNAEQTPPLTPLVSDTKNQDSTRNWVWICVIAVLGLLILWLVLSVLYRISVALRWLWKRLCLSRGSPEQRVAGAWQWLRMRHERYDQPIPQHASPDVMAAHARTMNDHELTTVANASARVLFDPEYVISPHESRQIWRQARRLGRIPSGSRLRQRWTWLGKPPRSN